MDVTEYHNALAHHLRIFARQWLQQAREDPRTYPAPSRHYTGHRFPPGFPFTPTGVGERFHWVDIYGSQAIRHAYDVILQHHRVPSNRQGGGVEEAYSRYLWIITFGALLGFISYLTQPTFYLFRRPHWETPRLSRHRPAFNK